MIYQYTKRYLKSTLGKPSVLYKYTQDDNTKYFTYIYKRYTKAEFLKGLSEVKQAFRDYFEPVGKLLFRYREENIIQIKLVPYSVNPKHSKHLENILKIINNNKKYIQNPYENQKNQIAILGKIRREINREVVDTEESVNINELIKYAIRTALKLSNRDVIVQLKRKYIIKLAKKEDSSKIQVKDNEFNGYTNEQIEETYKEIFENNESNVEYFINKVMKKVLQRKLNFRVIDNSYYEEKALNIIYTAMSKELHNYISLDNDYILGVAAFILKKNFYKIHEIMAIELIECIYEKDKNANKFLLYFDGKLILKDNKKYQVPALKTEDNVKWNNNNLISICVLWMNVKKKKKKIEEELADVNAKIEESSKVLSHGNPEKDAQKKILERITKELEEAQKKHEELEKQLQQSTKSNIDSDDYAILKSEVSASHDNILFLQKEICDAKNSIKQIGNNCLSTYSNLEILVEKRKELLAAIQTQNKDINLKSSQINPILKTIIQALATRQKLIH